MAASSTPPTLAAATLQDGDSVGRHIIDGWVRDGGMSVIYRGHHTTTGAKVAIKVIAAHYADDPVMQARFDREAAVMGRLGGDPNVVQVHDAGLLDDGRRYLAMEWIEGTDLEDLLGELLDNEEQMPLIDVCRIAGDVAKGLAAAHAKGIVHRDLKPSNVMLDRKHDDAHSAKVLDFGVSSDLGTAKDEDLTRTGEALGTSGYMAPEQALGMATAATFDVWALGVLLFEMTTGQRVPPGPAATTLPRVPTLRSGVPNALADLIRDCMHQNPLRRPQRIADVATRLGRIVDLLKTPAVTAGTIRGTAPAPRAPARAPDPGPEPGRRGMTVAAVAVLLLAFAGVAAWGYTAGWLEAETPPRDPDPFKADLSAASAEVAAPTESHAVEPTPPPPEPQPPKPESKKADPTKPDPTKPDPTKPDPKPAPHKPKPAPPPEAKKADPKPPPPAVPKTPVAQSERCVKARDQASDAKRTRKWLSVLSNTRDAKCWPNASERKLLRVTALAELGRYDACVKEGAGTTDPKVATRTRLCRKLAESKTSG